MPRTPPVVRSGAGVVMVLLLGASVLSMWSDFPMNGNPFQWLGAKETSVDAQQQYDHHYIKEALVLYQKAIKQYPGDANFHFAAARTLEHLQRYDEAAKELQEALRLKPKFTDAWLQLGNVQYLQGNTAEGEKATRQALQLAPNSSEAKCQLALMLLSDGKKDEAQKEFAKITEDSDLPPRYFFLAAQYYQLMEDPHKADMYYKRACLGLHAESDYYAAYGDFLYQRHQARDAVQWLRMATTADPRNATYWEKLGMAYIREGDPEHGMVALQRAVGFEPDNHEYGKRYAMVLFARKHYNACESILCKILKKYPDDDYSWKLLMDAFNENSTFGKAREALMSLAATGNDAAKCRAYRYSGDLYRLQGSESETKAAYRTALAANPPPQLKAYLDKRIAEDWNAPPKIPDLSGISSTTKTASQQPTTIKLPPGFKIPGTIPLKSIPPELRAAVKALQAGKGVPAPTPSH